jgi:anti-anti-sigma factor
MQTTATRPAQPATIRIAGEIDLATVSAVADEVDAAIARGQVHLLVDLQAVTFMGATLLGALVASRNVCSHHGGSLYVTRSSRNASRLLALTRLESLWQPRVIPSARPCTPGS